MRGLLTCTLVMAALLVGAQPATAGGWWTWPRLSRDTAAVGQQVSVHANVMFSSVDAVEAEQSGRTEEQFYVYLLRGFDHSIVQRAMRRSLPGNWWSLGDARAIRVGRVVFGSSASNLMLATASFTVPSLPIGTYTLMLCNAGCRRPLADVIPFTGFAIVADPVTARLAGQVERLTLQARRQSARLDTARVAAHAAEAESARLRERLDASDRRVAAFERSVWEHIPWLVAGIALGTLVALVRRRAQAAWAQSTENVQEPTLPTSPDTAARVVRARSSSRGGRPPARRRRSGARSRLRA